MIMNFFSKLPIALCLIMSFGLVMTSCGENEGPAGEPAKTKFIGDYVGEVKCAGVLASVINEPELEFNISNAIPEADDKVQVNLPSLPIPLELTGTVTGQNITMDETTVEDVAIPFNGVDITADISASGDGKLVGNTLTATINLIGKTSSGQILATDDCTITANKQ